MANETLSAKQADKIIERANEIVSTCKQRMETKNNEFVNKISTIWEDKNAVEYMKEHKKSFEDIISQFGNNNKIFAETVKDIATAYIKAGAMSVAVSVMPITLTANILIDKVKEFLANGQNTDDFGFKNPQAGAEQVMDAFVTLKTELEKEVNNAVNKIKGINAFGNVQIQNNLAQSAGDMVKILKERIAYEEKAIREAVDKTAQGYIKLGSSGETSAKISSN